jgi:hypothetical protein
MAPAHHEAASYREVDITSVLPQREAAWRDETPQLLALSRTIAQRPSRALAALADTALAMTGAQSAGISVVASERGEEIMRWVAAAGLERLSFGASGIFSD